MLVTEGVWPKARPICPSQSRRIGPGFRPSGRFLRNLSFTIPLRKNGTEWRSAEYTMTQGGGCLSTPSQFDEYSPPVRASNRSTVHSDGGAPIIVSLPY